MNEPGFLLTSSNYSINQLSFHLCTYWCCNKTVSFKPPLLGPPMTEANSILTGDIICGAVCTGSSDKSLHPRARMSSLPECGLAPAFLGPAGWLLSLGFKRLCFPFHGEEHNCGIKMSDRPVETEAVCRRARCLGSVRGALGRPFPGK